MCEKEKNQGVAMVQSKSRPQPDWNAVAHPQSSLKLSNTGKEVVKGTDID